MCPASSDPGVCATECPLASTASLEEKPSLRSFSCALSPVSTAAGLAQRKGSVHQFHSLVSRGDMEATLEAKTPSELGPPGPWKSQREPMHLLNRDPKSQAISWMPWFTEDLSHLQQDRGGLDHGVGWKLEAGPKVQVLSFFPGGHGGGTCHPGELSPMTPTRRPVVRSPSSAHSSLPLSPSLSCPVTPKRNPKGQREDLARHQEALASAQKSVTEDRGAVLVKPQGLSLLAKGFYQRSPKQGTSAPYANPRGDT